MLVASGTLLVLMTWVVVASVIISLGLLPSVLTNSQGDRRDVLRGALWWGLLVFAISTYLINLITPLQSATAGLLLGVLMVLVGVPGWLLLVRRAATGQANPARGLTLGAVVVLITLSIAALGPVTNYDSGLYHLQAIRYAADFPTIPGLANVYFPLGYANAEFPLAAVMGLGPWGFDGFRLINGLVIALALVELVMRARARRRGAGFFILIAGMTVVVITMLPLADYWVTSPTQDSSVLVITVVAAAYIADVVTRRRWIGPSSVVISLSTLLVMLRPTMVVFAIGSCIVLLVVALRRKSLPGARIGPAALVTAAAVIVAGVAATARDYVLSGWLQYPLSLYAFDVPWQAADPTDPRTATLGAARDPEDLWAAAQGWEWIPAWFGRLPNQWETYALALLGLAAVVLVVMAVRTGPLRTQAMLLTMMPSGLAVAFWWLFTPPSFRFAWGPLFTLATVPLGWALWRLHSQGRSAVATRTPLLAVSVMIVIVSVTLITRIDYSAMIQRQDWSAGITVPYVVTPPPSGDVTESVNPAGLDYLAPVNGEQCWLAFPTCSPQMAGTVRLRGSDIASGYLP